MQRAHAALAVSEGKMAQTRPCVYYYFFNVMLNYTSGLAEVYL